LGCWAEREREKEFKEVLFSKIFFLNLFNFSKLLTLSKSSKHFLKKTLKLLKLHKTLLNTMQTKHDAQALIASKLLK
jgi:hypothetical protein